MRDKHLTFTEAAAMVREAKQLAKGLKTILSKTYDLSNIGINEYMSFDFDKIKRGDTVYSHEVGGIPKLTAKGVNVIYKPKNDNNSDYEGNNYSDPNIASDGFRVGDGQYSY